MTIATIMPLAMLIIAQAGELGARIRFWQGVRFLGFLTFVLLVLAIIYVVKRIMAK